jgi:hypothetical protein
MMGRGALGGTDRSVLGWLVAGKDRAPPSQPLSTAFERGRLRLVRTPKLSGLIASRGLRFPVDTTTCDAFPVLKGTGASYADIPASANV